MSYLLDALSKAERERHHGQAPKFTDASADVHARDSRQGVGWLVPLLAVLLVICLIVVGYLWINRGAPQAPASSARLTTVTHPSRPVRQDTPAPGVAPPLPVVSADAVTMASRQSPPARQTTGQQHTMAAVAARTPASAPNDSKQSAGAARPPDNHSRYSQAQPSFDTMQHPDDVPEYAALSAAQRRQVTKVKIGGLLHSSVPGHSFVIINGKRYREGQKTGAGPDVVLINTNDVIFKQHGIRYKQSTP